MSDELIDVLDENGIKTGEILPRSEVHKRGIPDEQVFGGLHGGQSQ